jgi:hypothetical protein
MAVLRVANATRTAIVTAVRDQLDAGAGAATMKIYTGAQPATPADAAAGTLLATVVLTDPSLASITNGVGTGGDPASVNAAATGTAGWARFADSNGVTVMDGDVTATGGGGTVTLSSTSLTSGSPVDVTSITVTAPAS